jgi:hypothetical protein
MHWYDSLFYPCAILGWTFFSLPFLSPDQPWSQFFFATLFSPWPPLGILLFFLFFSLLKLFRPTHLLPPTDLLTYIFKIKVDSSSSTYSPINLKCATFIPTHLYFLNLFIFLLFLLREFCSPLHMDSHESINCMWVLHILIESPTYIQLIISKKIKNVFVLT